MSSKLSKNVGATMNAATQITMYANTVIKQPDISIKELYKLPQHQQTARTHAENWLNTIWPEIIEVSKDIISYAQIFDTAYKELDKLVDPLKKGDEKAKEHFKMLLTDTVLVGYQKANIGQVASRAADFEQTLDADTRNFTRDSDTAKKAYTKENNNLTALQEQEEAAEAEVHSLHIQLIEAAAVLGVLVAAMAAVSFFSFGLGSGALEAGIVAATDTEKKIKKSYAAAIKKKYDLQMSIKKQQEELALLNVAINQLKGFSGSTSDTSKAAQSVADGWNALGDDLTDLIEKLDRISPQEAAIVIHTQLSDSQKEWETMLAQARVLEPSAHIPVKQYKDMESFLNDITP